MMMHGLANFKYAKFTTLAYVIRDSSRMVYKHRTCRNALKKTYIINIYFACVEQM